MKEPGKKYNDEKQQVLVNDLRPIVSKLRSKAFAAASLVEKKMRIGQRIVKQEQNGASRAEYGKQSDRGRFGLDCPTNIRVTDVSITFFRI